MTIDLKLSGVKVGEKKNDILDPADAAAYVPGKEKLKLQSSLVRGDESDYKQALLLEKLRDALLEQTEYLMQDVTEDIIAKSRALAPRVFGWKNQSIPGLSSDLRRKKTLQLNQSNYESAWETLRGLETQSYRLEDPGISIDFFYDLQGMLINDGLKDVHQKHLKNHSWLLPRSKQIFTHTMLKKKKIAATKNESKLPKKTISQTRLEKDLEEKEIELRKIQSTKFQANPIPASSIIPKYKEIIKKHTTKTMEARQKANFELIAKIDEEKKRREEEKGRKHFVTREPSFHRKDATSSKSITAPTSGRRRDAIPSEVECTFNPKISQKVPDFKRAQESFERVLENSRNQKSTTIPVPFAMLSRERRYKPISTSPLQTHEKEKKIKPSPVIERNHMIMEPKSTRTTILKRQHLEEQKEAEKLVQELEMEQKRISDEKKRAVAERLRMKLVKTSDEEVENEKKEKLKRHQEYQKGLEKRYGEAKKEMKQRLSARRCLFERVQLDAARNQARSKVAMVLKAAGVDVSDLSDF